MADSKKKSAAPDLVQLGPVYVPRSLREAAKAKSLKTGISVSFVIREAVKDWIESEPEKVTAGQ